MTFQQLTYGGTVLIVVGDDADHDVGPDVCHREEPGPVDSAMLAFLRQLALIEWLLYGSTN